MLSATSISRTHHLLRTLAVRQKAQNAGTQCRSSHVLTRSRTVSSRFLSTQANTGEEQKRTSEEQESRREEPRHQRLDSPGGRTPTQPSSKGFTPIITGLLAVGVGLTTYGLYELYSIMHMWPTEIRPDLRSGLLAKRKGDLDIASQYLYRAWEQTKTLPLESFGPDPLLKTTGIGITLGGILEQSSRLADAYAIYEDTFWHLRTAYLDLPPSTASTRPDLGVETLKTLSTADKMRAVALAYKLGELAHLLGRPRKEEERWLVWSVEAVLRTVLDSPPVGAVEVVRTVGPSGGRATLGSGGGAEAGPNVKVLVEQLGLPMWSMRHDISAPFEALGTFYAEEGNIPFALPLYLQAIAILIPPAPSVTPVEDKCRGAQLMGNVAELLVRNLTSKTASLETISQAEAWAQKGLEVVMAARRASPVKHDVCEEALAVLLYNVAMVRELSGDEPRARALLSESLEQARKIDMQEGIQHAQDALQRLDGGADTIKPLVVDSADPAADKSI